MISAVVLAAGSASRFGANKLVQQLGDRPVIAHVVVAALSAAVDEVVVVVGHERDAVEGALGSGPRLRVVFNPDHAQGMSTSLKAGIDALPPESEAAIILLADQPGVTAQNIDAVVSAALAADASAARATYGGEVGHPVFLRRSMWPLLASITGDRGAGQVLDTLSAVISVDLPSRIPPRDVDTPADLQLLRGQL